MAQAADVDTLEEIELLLDEDPELALEVIDALPRPLREHPDVRLLEAEAHAAQGNWQKVIDVLERPPAIAPDDADAHHLLGMAYGELGNTAQQRAHFLRTWELDSEADAQHLSLDEEISDEIVRLAQRALEELPAAYRKPLGDVLIVLEERPSRELVAEGFDPRAYGLFEGLDHAEHLNQAMASQVTRIVLFAANLLADFSDPDELAEEVRITVLHEVGHYFGLDEEDMVRLGLD